MKNKRFYLFTFFVIISLGLAQCVSVSTITPTIALENTETQLLTVTETQTPLATSTYTDIPTLDPTEERANILSLLKSNGGCNLPCLWGITPGETTKFEAEKIFRELRLGLIEYVPRKLSGEGWDAYEQDYSLNFSNGDLDQLVDFKIQNELVKSISMNSIFLPNDPTMSSSVFKNALAAFAPEKIIPMLGVPTRISIDPGLGPGEGKTTYVEYTLYIVYDQKGIRLVYTVRDDLNNKYKVCPIFGEGGNTEDSIGILLASPNNSVPIETYDESAIQENRAIPIEKAAGISPEQFYNIFTQTEKPVCFNVFSNILPIP